LTLCKSIKNGPAGKFSNGEAGHLSAAIKVILYMIGTISQNRQHDLKQGIEEITAIALTKSPEIEWIIKKFQL
jgi:hypothetical protein